MENSRSLSTNLRPIPRQIAEQDPSLYLDNYAVESEQHTRRLKEYVQIFIKYRWLVATIAAIVVSLAALYSFLATPKFRANANLKISTYSPLLPGAGVEDLIMRQTTESDYLNTQVRILNSLSLADAVLSDAVTGEKVKNYLNNRGGFFSVLTPILSVFRSEKKPQTSSAGQRAYRHDISTLKNYLQLINIDAVRKTSLVSVYAETNDPVLSADIANAHSNAFIDMTRGERQQSMLDNLVFLKGQARDLADKVALSERELAAYAEENAIVSLNKDENIVVTQMSDLNSLLTAATAKRIKSESAFNEAKDGSGLNMAANDDESIQRLRILQKEAEAEYALLSEKFKPSFPKMVQIKARINALKANINDQKKDIVKSLEAEYKGDLKAEDELKRQLDVQKSKAFELSRREVQYNIMKREYESLKDLHQAVLRQLKEAQLSSENSGTNISIADPAAIPNSHSSPKRMFNIFIAMLIGPILGVGVALILESLDNTIKTPEEAERVLNVSTLGVVPMFSIDAPRLEQLRKEQEESGGAIEGAAEEGSEEEKEKVESDNLPAATDGEKSIVLNEQKLVALSMSNSIASEAFRAVRTSILLSSADNPPKLILVTSGQKAEGKTAMVSNLAVTLAQTGTRTLLIDADLRRPSINKQFEGCGEGAGLVEYLTGLSDLKTVIKDSGVENLSIISSGAKPPNPSELLGSKKMAELLAQLKDKYDYVFVDAPPVLPVTDAVILSRVVDGVVFVVRGQHTQQHVPRESLAKLKQVGANILGVVLNAVDINSGDYHYYRQGYYAYYGEDEPVKKKRAFG